MDFGRPTTIFTAVSRCAFAKTLDDEPATAAGRMDGDGVSA